MSEEIRSVLGTKEAASHFRIGTSAVEFNMFALNPVELKRREESLEKHGYQIITEKRLDVPSSPLSNASATRKGIQLFNDERFWESHEVLEQPWRALKGLEKNSVQGLILTAAAFVHYQKNEPEVCLSILKRARAKIEKGSAVATPYLDELRRNIDSILDSGQIRLFKLD